MSLPFSKAGVRITAETMSVFESSYQIASISSAKVTRSRRPSWPPWLVIGAGGLLIAYLTYTLFTPLIWTAKALGALIIGVMAIGGGFLWLQRQRRPLYHLIAVIDEKEQTLLSTEKASTLNAIVEALNEALAGHP